MIRLSDLVAVVTGSLHAIMIFVVMVFVFDLGYSRAFMGTFLLTVPFILVSTRSIIHSYFENLLWGKSKERVIIYGAGSIGVSFLRTFQRMMFLQYWTLQGSMS